MRGDDAGQIGGVEALVFGVLVFVIGTLAVANAWGVIDAKIAASAAAREATRAFVESRSSSTAEALTEAEAAARAAVAGHGRDPSAMALLAEAASLRRCARVTLRVEYPVPLVALPFLGRKGHGFTATGRHSEIVDPYRSGLPDTGTCPARARP